MYFVGSMVTCFMAVFSIYKIYRSIKGVLFPTGQLPSHFKEVRAPDWSHWFDPNSRLVGSAGVAINFECWDD